MLRLASVTLPPSDQSSRVSSKLPGVTRLRGLCQALLLGLLLVGCSGAPAVPQVQLNGVYSGYIRSDNGGQLTAALAVKNEGGTVSAGFAASTSSGVVSFPMQGTLSGNRLSLRYSDSSGSMTIDATASPSLIEGRFTLSSSSGSVSGSAYFTYAKPLTSSVSMQSSQKVSDLHSQLR